MSTLMLTRLPVPAIERGAKDRLRSFYDATVDRRRRYRWISSYYHKILASYLTSIVPEGSNVLEIGCGDGSLLRSLSPRRGVGVDFSPAMIEEARRNAALQNDSACEFVEADAEYVSLGETFDYIVLADCIGTMLDIQRALANLAPACTASTRIVICYHAMLWEPLLKLMERLRIRMPQPHHNWLSDQEIRNFAALCGLDIVKYERRMLAPVYVPLVSAALNRFFAPLPFVNKLCLVHLFVMRAAGGTTRHRSVSIIIPTKNERGTIRDALLRLPRFGSHQEIVFVDGNSTDGTQDEIRAMASEFPNRDIKLIVQPGRGKADAVRTGFSRASGDILMILDADLSVPPEFLARCYDAIIDNHGEFVMGSRLVYPMEKQAMRFLNVFGNRVFSLLFTWLLNQPIKDTLCGTKVVSRENYQKIEKASAQLGDFDPFGDFELIFGAAGANLKILQIPVRYRERTYGATNIRRFANGWLLLKMCVFALRKIKLR